MLNTLHPNMSLVHFYWMSVKSYRTNKNRPCNARTMTLSQKAVQITICFRGEIVSFIISFAQFFFLNTGSVFPVTYVHDRIYTNVFLISDTIFIFYQYIAFKIKKNVNTKRNSINYTKWAHCQLHENAIHILKGKRIVDILSRIRFQTMACTSVSRVVKQSRSSVVHLTLMDSYFFIRIV